MRKKKIGLVLEGGGMRGAYTAGVMSWFIENGYDFDLVAGISSGSVYGAMYSLRKPEALYVTSTEKAAHPRNSGLSAILHDGQVVGYDYMFDVSFKEVDFPIEDLHTIDHEYYAGVYDLEAQETIWVSKDDMDPEGRFIKAACTLPVMGRIVKINGKKYMDGGITTMIPIEFSMDKGCDYHVVVSTKADTFVRKPQKRITYWVMRWIYRKYPKMIESFEARTERYYEELDIVHGLIEKGNALKINPSVEMGVGRFGGNLEQYKALFALAYKDCEAKKDALDALFAKAK